MHLNVSQTTWIEPCGWTRPNGCWPSLDSGRTPKIFLAEHAGLGQLEAMVRQAWDLDGLADAYEEFIADFLSPSGPDPVTRMIELVHAWRRFPWIDPGLPAQVLPVRWSGVKAAQLFRRRHARWSGPARRGSA